jgi:hypothetical protein
LFGDYQSTNSKPLPPLSAQIVNPIFPQQPRRTFFLPCPADQSHPQTFRINNAHP